MGDNELKPERFLNNHKNHHFSLEHLYHFTCGECKGWWSIADYKLKRDNKLTCPHCGFESIIDDGI